MIDSQAAIAGRVAIAALIGLAAGLEREWSGHASGPNARFAGLRTFFLLGLVGGIAGVLVAGGSALAGTVRAAGGALLSVAAYVMAVRRPGVDIDGTTEAAALAIIALGVVAGMGWIELAAGAGAVAVLMLSEKARLHWFVRQLGETEFRAALQFALFAVVVWPLLPSGPYGGVLAIKPRALWTIVLVFSGLNFAGFVARKAVGPNRGLGVTGALGGIVSSTAVTLAFSRQSRGTRDIGRGLALGVIAACTVLVPRVLVITAALNGDAAIALLPLLAPPFVVGAIIVATGWREPVQTLTPPTDERNPLRIGAAIRLAVAFQVAMSLITLVRDAWGTPGVFASAAVLGLTDVDALTVSMTRPAANLPADVAARAIAIGILANTLLKLTLAVVMGGAGYRRRVATGLAALTMASALGLMVPFP